MRVWKLKALFAFLIVIMPITNAFSSEDEVLRTYFGFSISGAGFDVDGSASSNVIFGLPIKPEFGPYDLTLLFEDRKDEGYLLTITIESWSRVPNSVFFQTTIEGQIGKHLEIVIPADGITMSGALRLSRLN